MGEQGLPPRGQSEGPLAHRSPTVPSLQDPGPLRCPCGSRVWERGRGSSGWVPAGLGQVRGTGWHQYRPGASGRRAALQVSDLAPSRQADRGPRAFPVPGAWGRPCVHALWSAARLCLCPDSVPQVPPLVQTVRVPGRGSVGDNCVLSEPSSGGYSRRGDSVPCEDGHAAPDTALACSGLPEPLRPAPRPCPLCPPLPPLRALPVTAVLGHNASPGGSGCLEPRAHVGRWV